MLTRDCLIGDLVGRDVVENRLSPVRDVGEGEAPVAVGVVSIGATVGEGWATTFSLA